jgi:PAS domain S-box-containing protein
MNWGKRMRLSFMPIPALTVVIAVLYVTVPPSVFYEPAWLLPITNTLFVTVVCFIVAYIALRNYKATGRVQILLLGCGVLTFGLGGVIAGFARSVPGAGANLNVAIYNTGALGGAVFHFAAAFILLRGVSEEAGARPRRARMVLGYAGPSIFMGLFTLASLKGLVPPFFVQGVGPTMLRQIVLGAAAVLFAFAWLVFLGTYLRIREEFLYWYSSALALTAISLTAFFIQHSVGSPVGWAGRFSQYLGGAYFLIAMATAVRSAQARRTSFDNILTASLSPAEEKFRALSENSPDAISRFDREMRHIYINPAGLRLYARPAGAILGRTLEQVGLPEPYGRLWSASIQKVFEAGEPTEVEGHLPAGTGLRFYQSHCVPEYGADGRVANVLVVSRDLTERKRAEQALQENERRLVADLDAMTRLQNLGSLFAREGNLEPVLSEIVDTAIAICGADFGNIQLLDPESSDLHIAAQRGFPTWWIEFWNRVSAGQGNCGTALERGERVVVEDVEQCPIFIGTPALEIQRKAGVRAVQSTPLRSRSGRPLGMFSTHYKTPHRPDDRTSRLLDLLARQAADIIERAQSEESLRQAHAELELRVQQRTAELSQAVQQLEKQSTQLRALALELTLAEQRERRRLADVLHGDLQQLLVGAKLLVSPLKEAADPKVQEAGREVTDLLDGALRCSRSLTEELSPPILYMGGLIPALAWLARWIGEKHNLAVVLRAEETAPILSHDTTVLLFQFIRELLFNAVKHAHVNTAQIEIGWRDGRVQVQVADEGVGFDPAQLRVTGGDLGGFGLLGIQERLELLGGGMEIESAPGKGSRFTLWIPVQRAEAVATPAAPTEETSAVRASGTAIPGAVARKIRVLVVDDHTVVRQGMIRLLAAEPDIDVVGEAADGETAVALTRQLLPDVVTMDINMPGMNGVEATGLIHAECPRVRVIGLSVLEDARVGAAMREAGAVHFLTKHAPPDTLVAAIRACCPGPTPG